MLRAIRGVKMLRKKSGLGNYTSIIATIATAVLAITALITVYITISAWKEEQEANRPYFTFKESPKVAINRLPELEIEFTNVGEHPAVSLFSKTIVISTNLNSKPVTIDEDALVNDIPKNASATLLISLEDLEKQTRLGNVSAHFIVIGLRYEDPIIDKEFEQILYIKWNGIKDGEVLLTNHAEEEEKKMIINYFLQNNIVF